MVSKMIGIKVLERLKRQEEKLKSAMQEMEIMVGLKLLVIPGSSV